jgi:ABC-type uncharacterized transport system involved in gliding motility auxiliary subunit
MKSPITRATFGIIALVAIAVLTNWLISLTPYGNRGADFTENKIHTLSDGTKSILSELDTPVVIRYYATRSSDYMPEQLKVHLRRVDDLLKEYANLSNGKLRIENLDPQPDTDAEDSANLDEISGQRINEDNLYLGMAITTLDKKVTLPFLNPEEETMLEYQLSKAISEVSTPVKPVIGIIAGIDLAGVPAMMPGQQSPQPWVIYQQLKQSFELRDLGMTPQKIDPSEIKVLLVFHPAGISPQTEFIIDQYLLGGGTVVACLDPHSIAAQMTGGGNPMMGQAGTPTASTLPTLLPAWGVKFNSQQVVADPIHYTSFGDGRGSVAVLNLPQTAMPQKDSVITKNLTSITLYLPGAFEFTGNGGVSVNSLVRTSKSAGFVDPIKASQLDPSIDKKIKAENTAFDLVTFLSGNFKTAFPDGKPKSETPEAPIEGEPKDAPKEESLKEAVKPGNVFLIADIDAFYDRFAYNVQNFGGMQMANPSNGNSVLLFNIIDQAVGSKHLIGSRSRAATRRPFNVIKKMEDEFKEQVGKKVEDFETKKKEAEAKLQELQVQKTRGKELYLSPEQEAEIAKLTQQQVEYSRLIREQEKDLRRKKDRLAGNITLLNTAVVPSIVILFGLLLHFIRRSYTRAR